MTADKIKLPLGRVASPRFVAAFTKLCLQTGLGGRDCYALARTTDGINQALKAHGSARDALIRKYGEQIPSARGIKSDLQPGDEEPSIPRAKESKGQSSKSKVDQTSGIGLGTLAGTLDSIPPQPEYSISPAHPNWDAFLAELRELETGEVELFLDHKVKLPEVLALTPMEVEELLDLVE